MNVSVRPPLKTLELPALILAFVEWRYPECSTEMKEKGLDNTVAMEMGIGMESQISMAANGVEKNDKSVILFFFIWPLDTKPSLYTKTHFSSLLSEIQQCRRLPVCVILQIQ